MLRLQASRGLRWSRRCAASVPRIAERDLQALCDSPKPLLVHCGTAWSQRSQRVAAALAEWNNGELPVYALDLEASPETIGARHIKGVPTLLLLRKSQVEARADGADLEEMQAILLKAEPYARPSKELEPLEALKLAESKLDDPDAARQLFRRALEGRSDGACRARLGLLRCAVQALERQTSEAAAPPAGAVEELAEALSELVTHHEEELPGAGEEVRVDGLQQSVLLEQAALLVDAWTLDASKSEEEVEILRLWARGEKKQAVEKALAWYQSVAGNDIPGLIDAYCLPERRILDRRAGIPSRSIYSKFPELATDLESVGPSAPRALLRRLFAALVDKHFLEGRESLLSRSLGDLAFLLDRKEFIPFYTRLVRRRRGGAPSYGLGTGKRSGFSKRYWICWANTFFPNSRKMGSPHCDKNDS